LSYQERRAAALDAFMDLKKDSLLTVFGGLGLNGNNLQCVDYDDEF